MEFKFRGYNHTPSSTYTSFSDQAVEEGVWSGGQGRTVILRESVDVRDAIQREIEKERIREEILAEEIARKRALEAEVRREREMAMQSGGGFPSPFMVGTPLSHNTWFEPGMALAQPLALVERRIATSFDENFGGSGHHRRELGGYEAVPFQRLPRSPEDCKKKVIDLGKLHGATLVGAKRKQPPSPAEWSCAVCKFSTTCEHNFNQHLAGKKHNAKVTTLKGHKYRAKTGLGVACEKPAPKKSAKTQPSLIKTRSKRDPTSPPAAGLNELCSSKVWSCAVCEISATCERDLNKHLAGKKHKAKVAALSACDKV